jgi:transposase
MSWHTIKEIDMSYLKKNYSRPKVKHVRRIAIDEFSVKKRHVYMSVIIDVDTRRVLRVVEGRKVSDIKPVLLGIKKSGAKIEAVSMDMSASYIQAVSEAFPEAKIVFDKFHVIKTINTKLDQLRGALYRQEKDHGVRPIIKGTRWLLMYGQEKFKKSGKIDKLTAALELNKPLSMGYYLKEEIRLLWGMADKEKASVFIDDWIERARQSGQHYIEKMANSIARFRSGILAWFDHKISNGPIEGMNNKIKTLKRQAFNYRDMQYFKLKIIAMFDPRYGLLR